ncbi:tetratricopeptide repeat protein [Kitasatospora sp. NPDC048286]|uniref:tetratricopeptide repeat protein n=1 Tax=Kitasatospora sp. NPDC048286 TaxID=3364047 RepID=UPI003711B059
MNINVDDLSWQARTLGGVSPRLVQTFLDLGQLELLVQAARERGDWHCAKAAARELCASGEFERALNLLDPFTDVGWRAAEWATAEIMIQQGQSDEALAMVRPDPAELGDDHVCARYAELLAKAGRTDEAVDVLVPHLGGLWIQSHLVKVTEGQGRDDRVLDVLARLAEGMESTPGARYAECGESCTAGRTDRWHVLLLISQVLERTGRTDEAVEILRTEMASGRRHPVNFPEYYAELLARRGLIEELGALAAAEPYSAVDVFAKALEDAERAPEAEAMLRERIEAHDHPKDRAALMHLLVRQRRIDEAVETGRPTYDYYDCGNLLHWALDLLVNDGRPGRALELLEDLTGAWAEGHPESVIQLRLWLLGEAGRCTEGIAEATARNEREPGEWDTALARLLERAGRPEEAIALLRSSTHRHAAFDLADLLARHGRPTEALAAIPTTTEQRAAADRREREAAEQRKQDELSAEAGEFAQNPPF